MTTPEDDKSTHKVTVLPAGQRSKRLPLRVKTKKKLKRAKKKRKSVWTISGGLPSLGKRR